MGKMHRIKMSDMQIVQNGSVPMELYSSRHTDQEGLTTYILPPEEVVKLLKMQYGNKLGDVNTSKTTKQKQKHGNFNAFY